MPVSFRPRQTSQKPQDVHVPYFRMRYHFLFPLILIFALSWASAVAATEPAISAAQPPAGAIGKSTSFFQEPAGELTLDAAIAAYTSGRFVAAAQPVLTFGIGARPVWIHFNVDNPTQGALPLRLSIETAWLDRIEIYVRHHGQTTAEHHLGDSLAFALRPLDSRYFVVDHAFEPGSSEVYLRVQTPDPMVVPIYLNSLAQAQAREILQDYSFGFLYGFLFALMAYNAVLFAGLRDTRYLLYALYLGMFVLMNLSYTGHGFRWLWPQQLAWAQWSNPILMLLYGLSGLLFAVRFLDVRRRFPRVFLAVIAFMAVFSGFILLAMMFGNQVLVLLAAFTFIFLFTLSMPALGVMAMRTGQKPARYFLLASLAAMIGAALTTLSVWGLIPYTVWTFRAVDLGILFDATLLALALAARFRVGQEEKLLAERLARIDPLTGIDNRRAFYDKSTPVWQLALRRQRSLAVILLDIDKFKTINDNYGHTCGDEVLVAISRVIMKTIRQQDVAARWGGEEFILLLPETDLYEAAALAERLRTAIAVVRIPHEGGEIGCTASFGVAQREAHHTSLAALISSADHYLYQAKETGRDKVSFALTPEPV